jgi:hypothetical protein
MYASKPMSFYFAPTDSKAAGGGEEYAFASTPDGLVSHGDLAVLRHWIAQAGAGAADQQDIARDALFEAAGTGLVQLQNGKICNLRLYGWPISIEYARGTRVHSVMQMGTAKKPQMILKLRELWSRAFGVQQGVHISPFWVATNLLSLLSVNPVTVRSCVRRGISLLAGSEKAPFDFEDGVHQHVEASPEVPACFMLGAYVCWEVGSPEPSMAISPDVLMEMKQAMEFFFSSSMGQVRGVRVGRPAAFHSAITQAQGLQVAGMVQRAAELGQMLGMSVRQSGDRMALSVSYFDQGDTEDPVFEQVWTYSNVWRPGSHLDEIGRKMVLETEAIYAQAHARKAVNDSHVEGQNFQFH